MSTTDPQANATRSGGFLRWLADRTGLPGALRACPVRDAAGRPSWWSLWISLILCAGVIQAITGWVLWMYYSPSSQTAWESVYFIQYEVLGGWLLRGLHYWTAQVLVALLLLYLVQMIARGAYRASREFVFWTALGMAAFALALCLTGDLLSWDQNGYASTQTRVNFLNLLPWIGGALFRLAAGGPAFGHLTLTRFFALHVGCFAVLFFSFILAHLWLVRRAALAPAAAGNGKPAADASARAARWRIRPSIARPVLACWPWCSCSSSAARWPDAAAVIRATTLEKSWGLPPIATRPTSTRRPGRSGPSAGSMASRTPSRAN